LGLGKSCLDLDRRSARTTGFYDRRGGEISLDEVERIV
jgi:hypothetical protein